MAETAVPAIPAMMSGMGPVAKQGFYVAFSRRIYFEHVTITGHEGPAFILEGTEAVEISTCRGDHEPITEKQIRKTTDFFSIGKID